MNALALSWTPSISYFFSLYIYILFWVFLNKYFSLQLRSVIYQSWIQRLQNTLNTSPYQLAIYILRIQKIGNYQQTFYVTTQSNSKIENRDYINPLSTNPTKWSNTLKQFVRKSRRIVWVCLAIFSGWHLNLMIWLIKFLIW